MGDGRGWMARNARECSKKSRPYFSGRRRLYLFGNFELFDFGALTFGDSILLSQNPTL